MAQVDLMHVPYKGSGQALVDLIGGQVDMIFDNAPSALPMVQSGQVKAIAVTSAKRLGAMPELPTIAESMLPGYESLSWRSEEKTSELQTIMSIAYDVYC